MNELAEIGREIDTFTQAGQRVPTTVWKKYDRVNKRHKKREEMAAIAAEESSKLGRKRRAREREHAAAEEERAAEEGQHEKGHPSRHTTALPHNEDAVPNTLLLPKTKLDGQCAVAAAARPFRGGGGCTFGSGRGGDQHAGDALASCGTHTTSPPRSQSCSSASWGPHERDKLNEICEGIFFCVFFVGKRRMMEPIPP